jgi:hypothetical protein
MANDTGESRQSRYRLTDGAVVVPGPRGKFGLGLVVMALALAGCGGGSHHSSSSSSAPSSSSASTGSSSASTAAAASSSATGSTHTIGGVTLPTSTGSPTRDEAKQIATAAYVFGFPLVAMNGTEAQVTNVHSPGPISAPVNQFNTPSKPFTPSFTAVPAPPVDVLFSSAWLDVSKQPLVLTMPNTKGVYNQLTILSGWSNVLMAPGKRTTGTAGGNFLIAGPGFKGKVPAGVKLISSPTNLVWIEGSNQYNGPTSLATVNAVQAGYKLTPLSDWGKSYKPPTNVPTNASVDTSSTPQSQTQKMSPQAFFGELATLMGSNPPSAADAPVVQQMARIGIVAGSRLIGTSSAAPFNARSRAASPRANIASRSSA